MCEHSIICHIVQQNLSKLTLLWNPKQICIGHYVNQWNLDIMGIFDTLQLYCIIRQTLQRDLDNLTPIVCHWRVISASANWNSVQMLLIILILNMYCNTAICLTLQCNMSIMWYVILTTAIICQTLITVRPG